MRALRVPCLALADGIDGTKGREAPCWWRLGSVEVVVVCGGLVEVEVGTSGGYGPWTGAGRNHICDLRDYLPVVVPALSWPYSALF